METSFILSCESTIDLPYSYCEARGIPVLFYSYQVDGVSYEDDMGRDPAALVGRGSGLSNAAFLKKIQVLHKAVARNHPDPADPVGVLASVGGLDLAALCGLCLGGAFVRLPVLLDGFIADAAALCAVRLCPAAGDALLASHVSAEPGAKAILEGLGLSAPLCAGLRLGEGSGAVMALPLLDMALAVYHSGHTFGALGIDAYTPQH